ncbi:cobalt-precorrin-5B (C(1))-methyltransferase CbiD [Labilibaculum antarcticum]|uniref:Cobalt-precorrin-5B C(1)-methyltransferase n=1 Tax=Labilibaculum antarcticum TaxID=1717717 RepID=A0A1Y1CP63_9BACT|nr:cobalt-precorrin-5B (C(1))-methyltransferase CbiD [Labilibaculum antarcticum]BAX81803.1 cobalamin biosynthesis protein CbiD [Labilibaculum antarcticum]
MKILLFGGTTEGKATSNWLDDLEISHFYSTKTSSGNYESKFGQRISGAMNVEEIWTFCEESEIDLLIDAAHPFAEVLHHSISVAAIHANVPVLRVERDAVPRMKSEFIQYHKTLASILADLHAVDCAKIISLVGVKALPVIHKTMPNANIWYRILDFPSSLEIAKAAGVSREKLIVSAAFEGMKSIEDLLNDEGIEAMITKESGYSGLLDQKMDLAVKYQIPLYVIARPDLPNYDETITNRETLQKYLKSKFGLERKELAPGFTSGTCATISAKAALKLLLGDKLNQKESVALPDGEICEMQLHQNRWGQDFALCSVVKNSGDDPDVTDGMEIGACLRWNDVNRIRFVKGEGVGTVTLNGLGIPLGEPAVNPVPRKMIAFELEQILEEYDVHRGIDVSVFVPVGKKMGAKTFNPKLGIVDGISIIGTSGRIKPYSLEAYIQSIKKQLDLAVHNENKHIVVNSGGRSERYLKKKFPHLDDLAFLQYGNFIGEILTISNKSGIEKLSMGIMTGKAVKLAAGYLDTHSSKVVLDHEFLMGLARDCRYSEEIIMKIGEMTMGRELEEIFSFSEDELFFKVLKSKCVRVCQQVIEDYDFELLLISNQGEII